MNPFNNNPSTSNNSEPINELSSQKKREAIEKLILYALVLFAISFLAPTVYSIASPSTDNWRKAITEIWHEHNSELIEGWEDIWYDMF